MTVPLGTTRRRRTRQTPGGAGAAGVAGTSYRCAAAPSRQHVDGAAPPGTSGCSPAPPPPAHAENHSGYSCRLFISKPAMSHLLPGCCVLSSPPGTYTVPVLPSPFLPSPPRAGVIFISQRCLSTLSGGKNSLKFAHQKKATSAIGKINKN